MNLENIYNYLKIYIYNNIHILNYIINKSQTDLNTFRKKKID